MGSIFGEQTSARIFQLFEAEEREIVRILLSRNASLNTIEYEVVAKRGKVDVAAQVLLHTKDAKGNAIPVLSLELPKGLDAYRVMRQNKTIARMTPTLRYQLISERDLAMVNPAIDDKYHTWLQAHRQEIKREALGDFSKLAMQPRFSIIVPLFRTPIPYFHDMIGSVLAQTYTNWELILVNASCDDKALQQVVASYANKHIKVIELPENLGIAGNTNAGIAVATGDYISFFDHDDLLDEHILEMYVQTINKQPKTDLLYCDEDNFRESLSDCYSPLFKPNFNLDLLYSHNYVIHMLTVSRHALKQVELSPNSTSGAQDYDLTLKIAEVARSIAHIPYVLYHWRAHAGSTNGGVMNSKPYAITASIEALSSHFKRRGIACDVEATDITCVFRERYHCREQTINVVVPYKSRETIESFVEQFQQWNNGETASTLNLIAVGKQTESPVDVNLPGGVSLEFVPWTSDLNQMEMLNAALPHLKTNHVLVCSASVHFNNVMEILELSGCLSRNDVGIVAPKLFYRDGLVQHAGVVHDEHGCARFINQNFNAHMGGGYHGYAECSCSYSAVSPDCFIIKRVDLLQAGSLKTYDKNAFVALLNLCNALSAEGKTCTVLPHITATVDAPIIWQGCNAIQAYQDKHVIYQEAYTSKTKVALEAKNEPIYNPNVSLESGYPRLHTGTSYVQQINRNHMYAWLMPFIKVAKKVLGK